MKDTFWRVWARVKWPLIILAVAYSILVIWRVFVLFDEEKTAEAVAAIHAQKIVLAGVTGENLPPVPNEAENNSTVAGIDANNNGIRDDVELAIFAFHPNDTKVRAAELQYAMAMQLMLTRVTNSETWKAAAEEVSRGELCIGDAFSGNLSTFREHSGKVAGFVLNTPERQKRNNQAYKFTTSFGLPSSEICNLDSAQL